MKKTLLIKIMSFCLLSIIMCSCTKDFEKINTNPNLPLIAPATNVFASGINMATTTLFGTRLNVYYAGSYAGHFAIRTLGDYEYRVDINNSLWVSMYSAMTYFVDAAALAEKESNTNLQAVSLAMKAYVAQKTTDMWGDIPYSEAFKASEGKRYTIYDTQQQVYAAILSELQAASEMLNTGTGNIGTGDFIFNGNVAKWKAFVNSIRLRVAIRMSQVNENNAKAIIAEILGNSSAYPLIRNNSENAYLYYPGNPPDQEIWFKEMGASGSKTTSYRPNASLIDTLKGLSDPRLAVYADLNSHGLYNGYRFYLGQTTDTMNNANNVSHVGNRFSNDPKGFSPFMNCAEVYFIEAEAYLRGFLTGDAKQAYENGVIASLMENGLTAPATTDYLMIPEVAWTGNNTEDLKKIYLQKWISLYKQSVEAWSECRRTDVPIITEVSENYAAKHNRPPFRLPYPDEERSLNEQNYPTHVNAEDIFYGDQLWWDTRTGIH